MTTVSSIPHLPADRAAPPDTPENPARRDWLSCVPGALLLAGSGGALASAAAPAVAASAGAGSPAGGPTDSTFIGFPDERERFRAHFRFERDLRDEGEVVSWYHFTMFAVAPGQRPQPVVRFEGMEYSYFRRVGDLTWRIHAHNLSFPRDLATGAFTDRVLNPVTGLMVKPEPVVLLDDPGVLHSPRGYLPLDARSVRWLDTYLMFRTEGDLVKVEHIRPTPEGWPTQFIETSTCSVSRAEFDDPRVTSLKYQTSGFYLFPWSRWMGMGDAPGHMIGAWSGRKLNGPAELPVEFAARARREHPKLLEARWEEFNRPMPPGIVVA